MNEQPAIVDCVLELLRQWGWEAGLVKLRERISRSDNDCDRQMLQHFIGWMAAERGDFDEATAQFNELVAIPQLAGWAWIGLAFVAMRSRDFGAARNALDQVQTMATGDDRLLATLRLMQGTTMFHGGDLAAALAPLEESLTLVGSDCFGRGRSLDALGMWYAAHDDFQNAMEFLRQSIEHKTKFTDESGLAVTHGQLGRLYLDWGQLDLAEVHFRSDLDIARRIGDGRGEAQMYNLLGNLSLDKGDAESAAAYLDYSIQMAIDGKWLVMQGYAQKDRALCYLADNKVDAALEQLNSAQEIFDRAQFAEGLAHANRAWGVLHRSRSEWRESEQRLRQSLRWFESGGELTQVVRTKIEIARTLRQRVAPMPLVRDAYLDALGSAESSRRPHLVQQIDLELASVDPDVANRHIYRRVRGRRIDQDSTSLMSAEREHVTVMFFDLQGFTAWSRVTEPAVVMLCLNQMMAAFLEPITHHDVQVIEYMGDGFLALSRGSAHANRCVQVATGLYSALDTFNRPRRILGLAGFTSRIGISSGEVVLGNVGTYDKIDFRAVGTTVNLAARLQNEAIPGQPCIARATWEAVQHDFSFSESSPRAVVLKGIGEVQCWDVITRPGNQ